MFRSEKRLYGALLIVALVLGVIFYNYLYTTSFESVSHQNDTWNENNLRATGVDSALQIKPFDPPAAKLLNIMTGIYEDVFVKQSISQVGLVHFWASWCAPCVEELPKFIAVGKHFPQMSFSVISMDDTLEDAKSFLDKLSIQQRENISYLFDPKGDIAAQWGSIKLPETYVISEQGLVQEKFVGPRDWEDSKYIKYLENLSNKSPD